MSAPGERSEGPGGSSLVEWLQEQGLLRGPVLFVDYWESVLRLGEGATERRAREGLLDPDLFRLGLDRPDLEIPRFRHYLLLFLVGPFLLPFRSFRRMGRYRLEFRSELGRRVLERLGAYRLDLVADGDGRVAVEKDGRRLADGLVSPRRVAGFSSLFYATYKLPLASLTAILAAVAALPVLGAAGGGEASATLWLLLGFPILVLALWAVWRDWLTAVVGALPVVFVLVLLPLLRPDGEGGWLGFAAALAGIFVLYLLVDWFFMPRPVPPVLMLYTSRGPGSAYERREDAPWWLEGESYWVWRYLMLTPGELNKFWERDWERVELWIRADGPRAGRLEWVVTDAHYRELWTPFEKLGPRERLDRLEAEATGALAEGEAGFWLLEVDADPVFHTPFLRAVSYVPEEERVPVRSVGHLLQAIWKQAERDDPDTFRLELERAEIRLGHDLFEDAPEVASRLVAGHLLAQPWRYWRYPLGAATRRTDPLYGGRDPADPPPASDPDLQIKESTRDLY